MLEERDIAVVKMPHMLQENSNSAHALGVNSLTLSLSVLSCFVLPPEFIPIYSVPVLLVICSNTADALKLWVCVNLRGLLSPCSNHPGAEEKGRDKETQREREGAAQR